MSVEATQRLETVVDPLQLAAAIYAREIRTIDATLQADYLGGSIEWKPDIGIFSPRIAMKELLGMRSDGEAAVVHAKFWIGGDDECSAIIDANRLEQISEFDAYVYTRFGEIYAAHAHTLCFRALRQKRIEQLKREDNERASETSLRSSFSIAQERYEC